MSDKNFIKPFAKYNNSLKSVRFDGTSFYFPISLIGEYFYDPKQIIEYMYGKPKAYTPKLEGGTKVHAEIMNNYEKAKLTPEEIRLRIKRLLKEKYFSFSCDLESDEFRIFGRNDSFHIFPSEKIVFNIEDKMDGPKIYDNQKYQTIAYLLALQTDRRLNLASLGIDSSYRFMYAVRNSAQFRDYKDQCEKNREFLNPLKYLKAPPAEICEEDTKKIREAIDNMNNILLDFIKGGKLPIIPEGVKSIRNYNMEQKMDILAIFEGLCIIYRNSGREAKDILKEAENLAIHFYNKT